mgnify:FL=1
MSGLGQRLEKTAQAQIKDKGESCVHTSVTTPTYDPATGILTSTSSTQKGYFRLEKGRQDNRDTTSDTIARSNGMLSTEGIKIAPEDQR